MMVRLSHLLNPCALPTVGKKMTGARERTFIKVITGTLEHKTKTSTQVSGTGFDTSKKLSPPGR